MFGFGSNQTETKYTFHLAIEQKENLVLAHCLELDIMESGKSEEAAVDAVSKLVVAHLEYVIPNKLPLYSPAPEAKWALIQNQKGFILDVTARHSEVDDYTPAPFYRHKEGEFCLAH